MDKLSVWKRKIAKEKRKRQEESERWKTSIVPYSIMQQAFEEASKYECVDYLIVPAREGKTDDRTDD